MSAPSEQPELPSSDGPHELSWVAQFLRTRRLQAMETLDTPEKNKE